MRCVCVCVVDSALKYLTPNRAKKFLTTISSILTVCIRVLCVCMCACAYVYNKGTL